MSRTKKNHSAAGKPRKSVIGGKAGAGGYGFQAQVAAYAATYVLVRQRLGWVGDSKNDVPIALLSETGSLGDDLRIELADESFALDVQVKKGLTGGDALKSALEPFSTMPTDGSIEAVLVVDFRSSRTIIHELREDLRRVRQGRGDGLHDITAEIVAFFSAAAEHVPRLLSVVPLHLEERSDAHRNTAIAYLSTIVGDWQEAELAFELLEWFCFKQIRDRGRLTRSELVAFLRSRNIQIIEATVAGLSRHSAEVLESRAIHAVLLPHPDASPFEQGPRNFWDSQIDIAKARLEAFRPGEALAVLQALEETHAELGAGGAPKERLSRLFANEALALFRLGRLEEAEGRFRAALEHTPENATIQANLARILLIRGKTEEAADHAHRALAIKPDEVQAWATLAELGLAGASAPPESVQEAAEWRSALGVAALASSQYEVAVNYFRDAADRDRSLERRFMLAYALFIAEKPAVSANRVTPLIAEAESLLSDAISTMGLTSYSSLLEQALILRAVIRRTTGDLPGAEEDAIVALNLHPHDAPDLWRPAAVTAGIQLDLERPTEALATIRRSPEHESVPALLVLTARAHASSGDTREIEKAIRAAVQGLKDPLRRGDASLPEGVATCVEIALDAGLPTLATEVLASVAGHDLGWLGSLARARLAATEGDLNESAQQLGTAISGTDERTADYLRFELAAILRQLGRPAEAVAQYEKGHAWDHGDPIRASYVQTLIEARRFREAEACLQSLEATDERARWAFVPAAILAELRGDLQSAALQLERALEHWPGNTGLQLRVASLYVRLGRSEAAASLLTSALEKSTFTPEERMVLAGQLFRLEEHEAAVRQAFRAFRESEGTAAFEEVRRGFVRLVMLAEQSRVVPRPTVVGPATRVHLRDARRGGGTLVIDIVGRSMGPKGPNERDVLDESIEHLLGKRVRDIVTLEDKDARRGRYRVVRIESLVGLSYARAFQEMGSGDTEGGFRSIDIGQEGTVRHLMPVLSELFAQTRHEDEVLRLYQETGIPLAAVGRMLGRPITEAYWLIVQKGHHLLTEYGDEAHQKYVEGAAQTATGLVLTRSALITLAFLEFHQVPVFEALRNLGPGLVAPRSLIDGMREECFRLEMGVASGATRIGATESGFAITEDGPAVVLERVERAKELLRWVEDNVTVATIPLSALESDAAELRQVLDRESADAIEVAVLSKGVLYADDRGLCELIRARGSMYTSTRALLREMARRSVLAARHERAGIALLVKCQHYFTPVDAQLLVGLTRDHGYQVGAEVRHVFQRLADPQITFVQKVAIAAECLFELATSGPFERGALREVTLRFLVDLGEVHQYELVAQAIRTAVVERFTFLHAQREVVVRAIGYFVAAKRLGGELS